MDIQLFGDTLYGQKSDLINRQALHAYQVSFIHPILNNEISFNAPIPIDMLALIRTE